LALCDNGGFPAPALPFKPAFPALLELAFPFAFDPDAMLNCDATLSDDEEDDGAITSPNDELELANVLWDEGEDEETDDNDDDDDDDFFIPESIRTQCLNDSNMA
jgi:hypothetical protein